MHGIPVLTMRLLKEYQDFDAESEKKRSLNFDHLLTQDFEFLRSSSCILNSSANIATVSSVDLATLSATLRTIIPPPEKFEKRFRNPCWYMSLNLPLKVSKALQASRGNMSDIEATNLMNLIFSSSPQQNGHGGGKSLPGSSQPPRSLVCLPQIYFIGFPRSGSTQLYKMLISHPDLAGGMNKEPHWWTRYIFSTRFPHNVLSVIRYLSHFHKASEEIDDQNHTQRLLIDGSQSTVWDVRTTNNLCALPNLVTNVVPNAKFIVLMRNPVDRLFSDFRYLCEEALRIKLKGKPTNRTESDSDGDESLLSFNVSADVFHDVVRDEIDSFNHCLESGSSLELCTYLSTITMPRKSHAAAASISNECSRVRLGISLYHVHLKRWLKVIPDKQMLFLRTEDMSRDPYSLLGRIWKFLDVERQARDELNEILYKHAHSSLMGYGGNSTSSADVAMHQKTRDLLVEFFKPHNTILSHLMEEASHELDWIDQW